MRFWLSSRVFEWANSTDGGRCSDLERVTRPHALLAHCERVLAASDSEFSIADAILGLKRAINSRLQHIEELYGFRAIFPKGVGALERLEQVGLARPFLVRQLFELRNDIEHNDAKPPTSYRVRELVDLTWYFLKTTDSACKLVPDGVILRAGEEGSFPPEQWISVRPSRDHPGHFDIAGWVHMDLLSPSVQEGFFEIQLSVLKTKESAPPKTDDAFALAAYAHNSARSDAERWIVGMSALSPELQIELWRLALDARK